MSMYHETIAINLRYKLLAEFISLMKGHYLVDSSDEIKFS